MRGLLSNELQIVHRSPGSSLDSEERLLMAVAEEAVLRTSSGMEEFKQLGEIEMFPKVVLIEFDMCVSKRPLEIRV